MPIFDSFHDQIQQFNNNNFRDSRNSEALIKEIRAKLLGNPLEPQYKIRLLKEANFRFEYWLGIIKHHFFKIFICLSNLNIIKDTNWEDDHREFGEFLAEKRHSQIAFVNNLFYITNSICDIDSISDIKREYIKSELIKDPKISKTIIDIYSNYERDFEDADINNLEDLRTFCENCTYIKLTKSKRRIPVSNLTICNESEYTETHSIVEEANCDNNPSTSSRRNSTSPIQSYPSWNRDRAFPSWRNLPAPIWKKSTAPFWNKRK